MLITLSSNQGKTNKVPEMGVLSSIVIPIASPMLYLIPLCMQNGPNASHDTRREEDIEFATDPNFLSKYSMS